MRSDNGKHLLLPSPTLHQCETESLESSCSNAMVRRNFQLNGLDSIDYDGTLSQVQAIQNAAVAQVYGLQVGTSSPVFFISGWPNVGRSAPTPPVETSCYQERPGPREGADFLYLCPQKQRV